MNAINKQGDYTQDVLTAAIFPLIEEMAGISLKKMTHYRDGVRFSLIRSENLVCLSDGRIAHEITVNMQDSGGCYKGVSYVAV